MTPEDGQPAADDVMTESEEPEANAVEMVPAPAIDPAAEAPSEPAPEPEAEPAPVDDANAPVPMR